MIRLDFRSAYLASGDTCFAVFDIIKELFVSEVNTLRHLLDDLTRQLIPMWFRPLFQLRDMTTYPTKRRIFTIDTIIASLQLQKVNMHSMQIVNQVANLYQIRLVVELIFFRFHGISHITPLTPLKWVGRHTIKRLCFNCLPV